MSPLEYGLLFYISTVDKLCKSLFQTRMAFEFALISESLLKTALHQWHSDHQGRMVDYAGWSMPVQYSSIIEEHQFTRRAVGLFDVSHMGRLVFHDAAAALDALEKLTTRRVDSMGVGQIRYSLVTNDQGCPLDDILVYHLQDANVKPFAMLVVNSSNRKKVIDWLEVRLDKMGFEDRTYSTAMFAVQGPLANQIVAEHSEIDPNSLRYYTGTTTRVCGHEAIVTRTGYTGEDGCELIVDDRAATEVWDSIHGSAVAAGGGPCGLASRDTLRLEAGMPLYEHELTEQINAAQTSLEFAINLKNRCFPGHDAIRAAQSDKTLPVRVGLALEGKRPARQDCPVTVNGNVVGTVTSGSFGPTVERSISMAYLDPQFSHVGTRVTIDIRGKEHPARVIKLPFYIRS